MRMFKFCFFFSSRRRHTRWPRDWSSDVCSSDLKSEPLEEGGRGAIVNTASIAGYEGQIGQLPYSAAKGGVLGMTLVAARDLSPLGIRVVTIAPGTINTPAYGKAADQLEQYWAPQVPFPKRM